MTAARIKTAELAGAMLDYYVAKADGRKLELREGEWFVENDRRDWMLELEFYKPSVDWHSGGPLIEREGLCIEQFKGRKHSWQAFEFNSGHTYHGPTPLVAAMRAYVASKFGDEVEAIEGGRGQ